MCRGEEATMKHIKGISGDTSDNPIKINTVKKYKRGAQNQAPDYSLPLVSKGQQET